MPTKSQVLFVWSLLIEAHTHEAHTAMNPSLKVGSRASGSSTTAPQSGEWITHAHPGSSSYAHQDSEAVNLADGATMDGTIVDGRIHLPLNGRIQSMQQQLSTLQEYLADEETTLPPGEARAEFPPLTEGTTQQFNKRAVPADSFDPIVRRGRTWEWLTGHAIRIDDRQHRRCHPLSRRCDTMPVDTVRG